jgi:hypothetical protein
MNERIILSLKKGSEDGVLHSGLLTFLNFVHRLYSTVTGLVSSNGQNLIVISPPFHLRTETDPFSETLRSIRILDEILISNLSHAERVFF